MFYATDEGKKEAIALVDAMVVGYGNERYTNISEGLEYAMSINADFKRIVLFSDGAPTVGITGKDGLIKLIKKLQDDRKKNGFKEVKVNVNLLMLGGAESQQFREVAKFYTKLIATETDGVVKNYDSNKKED